MEGVTGLKSLGVRDLTYRLAFLATTVTPTDLQVDWLTRLLSPLLISLSSRPLRPHILFPFSSPFSPPSPHPTHFSLTPSHLPPPSMPIPAPQFGSGQVWGHDVTLQEIQANFTSPEWQKVFEMSQDSNLYQNLITSMFPTIHGQWGWGRWQGNAELNII